MQVCADPPESCLITADSSEQKARTPVWFTFNGYATT
jgi:hypothetical protein